MKGQLTQLLEQAIHALKQGGHIPESFQPKIQIDNARDKTHGDYASNVALLSAKTAALKPRDWAQMIIEALPDSPLLKKVEVAGPGFINFFVTELASLSIVKTVLSAGDMYGQNDFGQGRKVQVEFVSANPTGPLHVGHGRGAAVGDCLCRLLAANGWSVTREFYYNDAGNQIDNLMRSVQARAQGLGPDDAQWPEDGYRGEYIAELAQHFSNGEHIESADKTYTASGDITDTDAIRQFAVAYLRREQDLDLKAFGVNFDVYFLESSLYEDGQVESVVDTLVNSGATYEKDGALWLKTTDYGDDKDRVMRKSEGGYTYFLPDVAYHLNKWRRGFERVINEQGADHHSTITRVRAGLQALGAGIPAGWPDYVLHQMVTVMKDGQEVKLSKRAGSYVTLRDLIDEVGADATRYFLVARAPSSQLTFDIDLARSRSNENPVYYIQYAHARVCSIFRKLSAEHISVDLDQAVGHLGCLIENSEKELGNTLARFPEVVKTASDQLAPHQIANYLHELASQFHAFYNSHQVIVSEPALRDARVALAAATRQVLANGLGLLGISAPQEM